MTIARTATPSAPPPAPAVPPPPPLSLAPPPRRRRLPIAATIGALVVAGVAAAFWGGSMWSSPSVVSPPPASSDPAATGLAERFMVTFLTDAGEGAEASLVPFLGYAPDLTGMPPGVWYITHTAAVEVTPTDLGRDVLVAVDLLSRADGGYQDAGTRYFNVEIRESSNGLRVADLPTVVAAPNPPNPGAPPASQDPSESPALSAVESYLTWYLTDSLTIGDLQPVGGFESLSVQSLTVTEQDAGGEATVRVLAVNEGGAPMMLLFRLALLLDPSGAWMVTGIIQGSN